MTDEQRAQRLQWCLQRVNENFDEYVFCDETKIPGGMIPNHQSRLPTAYPDAIEAPANNTFKVNVWCAISTRGISNIVVRIDQFHQNLFLNKVTF